MIVEEIARELNQVVVIGSDLWELLIYSSLSPCAPEFLVDGEPTRATLHTMLLGEVATAKSKICRLVSRIAPKSYSITRATLPSFEGVASGNEIKEGVIDKANDGLLIIKEFRKIDQSFLREVMDCETVKIEKRGLEKEVDVNISMLVGSNPHNDFFMGGKNLRSQVDFQEGLLRRFDLLIPLINTAEKNRTVLKNMRILGGTPLDLKQMKVELATLATGMRHIERVVTSDENENRMKDAYYRFNKDYEGVVLTTLLDVNIIARLVNVIATTNCTDREVKDRVLIAERTDVDKALEYWETLLDLRARLYTMTERDITSVDDLILAELMKGDKTATELKEAIIRRAFCCERTVERKINRLVENGEVDRAGKDRNPVLSVFQKKLRVGVD